MNDQESQLMGACGYPKRFIHRLHDAFNHAKAASKPLSLMVISIDNMTMLLSGYGLHVSEQVMGELLQSISKRTPKDTPVFRVQRDQFAVLLHDVTSHDAHLLADRLVKHICHHSHGATYGAMHIRASTSVVDSLQNEAAENMLTHCILALADDGFSPAPLGDDGKEFSREEMGLANYLSQAISEKRLRFAFQPIVNSKTGEISHYEALLRLFSQEGKITSAGALIPVAERMGMIETIDKFTLNMVVKELRHDPDIHLAFNISNITTHDPEWMQQLSDAIEQTPDIGERMIIELTETSIHRDLRHAAYFCAQTQALGCQVALDDFGAGYTSFRQLKSLSVDMVKIDGAFVKDLIENADNQFFVKTLLDFTHGFGLKSVAEFVENGETAKMLIQMGADYLQGYYFGKPENHRKWLSSGEYSTE
jgi:EAL domain-containing protein (putative c-di-GMP-specific phosphodiesterase class I)/GGDEF domain-containing protein